MTNVWFALGLTVYAGLATGVGSAIAFFAKSTNYRFLSVSTGFSADVMLYVSFVEIFNKGFDDLAEAYGDYWGRWINAASFFGGLLLIDIIDNLIPSAENPHETHAERIFTTPRPHRPLAGFRCGRSGWSGGDSRCPRPWSASGKASAHGSVHCTRDCDPQLPGRAGHIPYGPAGPEPGRSDCDGDCSAQPPRRDKRLGAHLLPLLAIARRHSLGEGDVLNI
jgi:zinc transporter ZupT